MLTNIDQGDLRGRNMINIHNPLTVLLGWDTLSFDCWINSSNYTINSILLSEQRLRKCVTLVVSIKGILLLCSTKTNSLARHNTFLHKNHYTKYVDQVDFWRYTGM